MLGCWGLLLLFFFFLFYLLSKDLKARNSNAR
jgi:hypothetical protein